MTAYAVMVEELTGNPVPSITAIVGVEGLNTFQIFQSSPEEHVEDLVQLRKQYRKIIKQYRSKGHISIDKSHNNFF